MANVNKAVKGLSEFQARLALKKKEFGSKLETGLKLAGVFLQRESQQLAPVDYGILKASAFTRSQGKGFKTVVNVGYTAAYAMYVHENVEMKWRGLPRHAPHKGNYWDPAGRGQAKFLEAPARTKGKEILAIVKNATKLDAKGGA